MTGIELIARERQRQVSEEGWTPEHDDGHVNGEMVLAAVTYMHHANFGEKLTLFFWPWEAESWKPSPDPIINLTKAGALIAAEIDRLQRAKEAAMKAPTTPSESLDAIDRIIAEGEKE